MPVRRSVSWTRSKGADAASSPLVRAQHGLQVVRLRMDLQPLDVGIALPGPEEIDDEVFRPLLPGVDGEIHGQAAVHVGVAAGLRLEGGALRPGHVAGEVDVLHAGVAARQRQLAGHALELGAPQLRVHDEQAAHALQQVGMRFQAPLQRIGEQVRLLLEAQPRDGVHGRLLLLPQRIARRAARKRHRHAW